MELFMQIKIISNTNDNNFLKNIIKKPILEVFCLDPILEELTGTFYAVRVAQVAGPAHHQGLRHHCQELRGVRHGHLQGTVQKLNDKVQGRLRFPKK
jgi:hypothetical protein